MKTHPFFVRLHSMLGPVESVLLARQGHAILYSLAIAALAIVMMVAGFRITATTNAEVNPYDQNAYIFLARQMEGAWYPWYTDGTRNPLFPWFTAQILDANHPDFFLAGKRLNVGLATLCTILVAGFFRRRMTLLTAFNATAVAGLGALLPIATFFGAEPLFFTLFLFLCVYGVRLLNTNPLRSYAVLGLLTGLAYLTKPSTTPFLLVFLGLSVVRGALQLLRRPLPWPLAVPDWSIRRFLVGMAIFSVIFGALISPRLVHAHRTWGSAAYNLPGFWFWADNWQACITKYTDCRKVTLAKLPPEEQPSASGFFLRHDWRDAVQRVTEGTAVRLQQLLLPEEKVRWALEKRGKLKRFILPYRGLYLATFGALAVAMVIWAASRRRLDQLGAVGLPCLFGAGLFLLYLAATAWYQPIGPGNRFIMTMYLPLLWMTAQGGDQARSAIGSTWANRAYLVVQVGIAGLIIWRMAILMSGAQFEKILGAF